MTLGVLLLIDLQSKEGSGRTERHQAHHGQSKKRMNEGDVPPREIWHRAYTSEDNQGGITDSVVTLRNIVSIYRYHSGDYTYGKGRSLKLLNGLRISKKGNYETTAKTCIQERVIRNSFQQTARDACDAAVDRFCLK